MVQAVSQVLKQTMDEPTAASVRAHVVTPGLNAIDAFHCRACTTNQQFHLDQWNMYRWKCVVQLSKRQLWPFRIWVAWCVTISSAEVSMLVIGTENRRAAETRASGVGVWTCAPPGEFVCGLLGLSLSWLN